MIEIKRKEIRKDIKNLIEQGRFEDIYRKYGNSEYALNLHKMNQIDVYNETGNFPKSLFFKIKSKLRYIVLPYVLSAGITASTSLAGLDTVLTIEKNYNEKNHSKEIDKYNEKINDYAKYIQSLHLTDLQIFMKVIKDMWNEIDGYKVPENEIPGFYRLSLQNEKIGVCRNFADDIAAKLNAINPKYDANNMVVNLAPKNYKLAQIDRNVIQDENDSKNQIKAIEGIKTILPNHAVTSVNIPSKNLTLILDPTNPSIGVLKDGKIYMFSSENGKGLEIKELSQFLFYGKDSALQVTWDEVKSLFPCEYSIDELKKEYGVEAQNLALKQILEIEKKDKRTAFVEKLKPSINVLVGEKNITTQSKGRENGENNKYYCK